MGQEVLDRRREPFPRCLFARTDVDATRMPGPVAQKLEQT